MSPVTPFDRFDMLSRLRSKQIWDVVVIGGGATGLGTALEAASRGCTTLLLEQHDFAKGTSSRSTKLIHGGVRYLAQGNIALVYGALHERTLLLHNAPHLVKPLPFIIPCYSQWEKIKYSTGLRLYDWLSGGRSVGRSSFMKKETVLQALPALSPNGLLGGVRYFDGQFDDARLAINLAQTAAEHQAVVLNYCKVTALIKHQERITGVATTDALTGEAFDVHTRAVVNATGVFVDEVLKMDDPEAKPVVTTSQGTHIVVDKRFLYSNSALMIPKTSDGRVLFAVPWQDHVLIGTTDNALRPSDPAEPVAMDTEIQFLLDGVSGYLVQPPVRADITSVFAGLRPLAADSRNKQSTREISRDHKLIVSKSGLITITGGKWTTYRRMAEDVVDRALPVAGIRARKSVSRSIQLHGHTLSASASHLAVYGSDEEKINALVKVDPSLSQLLVTGHPNTEAEVVWAVRHEMAVTIEDVLARRLRLLFVDAAAASRAAPTVANLMMKELHLSDDWKQRQLIAFQKLVAHYRIN